MTKPIPNWLMRKYSILWNKYKGKEFSYQQAMATLKEDDRVFMSITLSRMKKDGWLKTRTNQKDKRKNIYSLEIPEDAIKKMETKK